MDVVVILLTLPICDELIQLSLIKAQETILAFQLTKQNVGKVVQGTNISMFYFNFSLWNRGINVFFIVKQTKFHIFITENQVLLDGPEGRESFKKFLGNVLNPVPTLVTIVGSLAGHLLFQMLHMTLINGLCYPCSMHAHCPSDHSLFPWSICYHPNYPLLHTWWWTLGIIWTCLFFLSFFFLRAQCFDVRLCAPPGTSQLRALATLARIANAFRRIIP